MLYHVQAGKQAKSALEGKRHHAVSSRSEALCESPCLMKGTHPRVEQSGNGASMDDARHEHMPLPGAGRCRGRRGLVLLPNNATDSSIDNSGNR